MNSSSAKGVFLLDIEVELAWGTIDRKIDAENMREASQKVREQLSDILSLLDAYNVPATWGIVGHLILSNCSKSSGLPHPNMPRPSYHWIRTDWYKNDPCTTLTEEPAFYGTDIVDRIVEHASKSSAHHDIACHSFSHQLFGDYGCTREVAEAEVKQCLDLLRDRYGIRPAVFIFPRDSVGHIGILKRHGFVAFRGAIPRIVGYSETDRTIISSFRKHISLLIYLTSFYLAVPPPVVNLERGTALVNIPASLCYNKKPFIPLRLVVNKATNGIERAIKERKVFHLYTHLINFGAAPRPDEFIAGFERILAWANQRREEGTLKITTIRQLVPETANSGN